MAEIESSARDPPRCVLHSTISSHLNSFSLNISLGHLCQLVMHSTVCFHPGSMQKGLKLPYRPANGRGSSLYGWAAFLGMTFFGKVQIRRRDSSIILHFSVVRHLSLSFTCHVPVQAENEACVISRGASLLLATFCPSFLRPVTLLLMQGMPTLIQLLFLCMPRDGAG